MRGLDRAPSSGASGTGWRRPLCITNTDVVSTGTQVQVRTDRHVQLRGTYVQVCTDPELQLRTGSTYTRRVPKGVPSTTTTTKARILPLTSSKKWRAARRQFWQNCDLDKKQGLSAVLQKLSLPIMLLEFIRFSTLFRSTKVLVIPVPIRY